MRRRGRSGRDELVSAAAKGVLSRLDPTGEGFARARSVAAWRDAAGDEVASHARGFALREGELLVFVDSAVWASELSALSEHYREAVNDRIGQETVTSVRFTVSKRVAADNEWDRIDGQAAIDRTVEKVTPVPATETEVAQLAQMAAGIGDDCIHDAVMRAALRHLEWRKGIEARNAAQGASEQPTDAS